MFVPSTNEVLLAAPKTRWDQLPREPASSALRVANFVIDTIFRSIAAYSVTALWTTFDFPAVGIGFGISVLILYYLIPEWIFGRTLAKVISGTLVISTTGAKLTFAQVLVRTLVRYIPFEPLSFFGTAPGWHDRWSKTIVVEG